MLIEVCVDDAKGLAAAIAGGADRIELCAALPLGGLTPSAGFMQLAARAPIPVFAMIRPRPGDFVFSPDDTDQMLTDIALARHYGLAGVVLGASLPDNQLDKQTLATLIAAAGPIGLTLHRAFDLTPDPFAAVDSAISLGFHRILTSGQSPKAPDAAPLFQRLFSHANGRIALMPGSGITPETVHSLTHLPLTEIHASCSTATLQSGPAVTFGFAPATQRHTDPAQIRALRAALTAPRV